MEASVSDFQEAQRWLRVLDATANAKSGPESFELKRAVAVVRNLMETAHAEVAASREREKELASQIDRINDLDSDLQWLGRQGDFSAYSVPNIPHAYQLCFQDVCDDEIYVKGEFLLDCIAKARSIIKDRRVK